MLKFIEGDIAKMAVREYENGLNMIKYLTQENESLKLQNQKLERDLEGMRMELDLSK